MKNLKQVITNALLAVFGVLVLGFGAGYYVAASKTGIAGYDLLDSIKESIKTMNTYKVDVPAEYNLYMASMILTIVFACVLVVLAALTLLTSLNVIKSEKLNKILNIVNLVISLLLLLFVVLSAVAVAKIYEHALQTALGYGLIINIVVSALALITSVVAMVFARKKA